MRRVIVIAATLSLAVAAGASMELAFAQSHNTSPVLSPKRIHHVVIQIDSDDAAIMTLAMNNADNLRKFYESKGEKIEIEFVAFGNGLAMMRTDRSPVSERLAAMSQQGVKFSGCGNSLTNQSKSENRTLTLLPEAHLVPTGVARITELEEAGWTYLRP
jgi:uncharacterized protein